MATIKIQDGNAFKLRITGEQYVGDYKATTDLNLIDSLMVNFVRRGRSSQMASVDDVGRAIALNSGDLALGVYGVELTGYYNGEPWRFYVTDVFEIVDEGADATETVVDGVPVYDVTFTLVLRGTSDISFVDAAILAHDTSKHSHVYLQGKIDSKVADIKVDGESVVEVDEETGNREVNFNSEDFGKVDDVKVNGVSVVLQKEAIINVPTKTSDLQNDSDFVNKEGMESALDDKQDTISDVNIDYQEDGGSPDASAAFNGGVLIISMKNMKMKFSELTEEEKEALRGPQGLPGDSVIVGEGDLPLANTLGDSSEKAISQKIVTEMLNDEGEIQEAWSYTKGRLFKFDGTTSTSQYDGYTTLIDLSSLNDNDRLVAENLKSGTSYKGGTYFNANNEIISTDSIGTSCNIRKADMPEGTAKVRFNFTLATPPVIKFIRQAKSRVDEMQRRLDNLDITTLTTNQFVNNKYIKSADGTEATNASMKCTPLISLDGAKGVRINRWLAEINTIYGDTTSSTATIAFYTGGGTYISCVHNKYGVCPANAAYIRVTIPSTDADVEIKLYGASSNSKIEKIQADIASLVNAAMNNLTGKRVAFIGDSVTAAGGITSPYHKVFADLAGCTNVNLGDNGSTIASGTGRSTFVSRATSANLANADMVVIFGGTNDFTYDTKAIGSLFEEESITPTGDVGNKQLIAPSDTDTFSGALHELILQIRSIIGEKPIVLMTPLNRGDYGDDTRKPSTRQCNRNGDYLKDFVNAIKEIGRFYGIPVFDSGGTMNFDPTDRTSSAYTSDLLHPNQKGHTRLGYLLYKWCCHNIFIN